MKIPKIYKYTEKSDIFRIKAGSLAAGVSGPILLAGPIFGFNIFIFQEKPQKPYEKNIQKRAEDALEKIVYEELKEAK